MDVGGQLRRARETRDLSVETLARRTRVQPRILAAIERNDLPSIPPKPFGRGFVRAYAQEVGLDPDQTVREYFAQFAPPPEAGAVEPSRVPEPAQSPGQWVWVASGTAIVALVVAAMLGGAPGGVVEGESSAIGTAGGTATADRESRVAGAAGRLEEQPASGPAVQPDGLIVVLAATDDCWITATADGERVIYRLFRAGTTETVQAGREIAIRAGNAGALHLTINGRNVGPIGGPGDVREIRITPETAATVQ